MFGKLLRGFYVYTCYIVAVPILTMVALIITVHYTIRDLISGDGIDFDCVKELMSSFYDGLQEGHERNKWFIKHGNQPMDFDEMAKDL